MKFTADLHIHSRFSRAVSREMDLHHIDAAARLKGVTLISTGDILHPEWREECREGLVMEEEGLFRFKGTKGPREAPVRFILSGEISSIYRKGGRVRKVHNLLLFPSFEEVDNLARRLSLIGNLTSDGRPILGLDSRNILEIMLETSPESTLIPAHIWTPWFSVLGSKSGFDEMEECFEDLTPHILSVETGLSSDPSMNWRVSGLDRFTLVSNSDAHSPSRLGREANLFDCDLSYPSLLRGLREGREGGFLGTIEFFPEEGKYHFDGHRKCGRRLSPAETERLEGICPVCGRPVTRGVMNRVMELADREEGMTPPLGLPFYRLIPLTEILSEIFDTGPSSKKVSGAYSALIREFGSEMVVLVETPPEEVEQNLKEGWSILLAEAIERMRRGDVMIEEGYDGEYGKIRLFRKGEKGRIFARNPLFRTGSEIDGVEVMEPEEEAQFVMRGRASGERVESTSPFLPDEFQERAISSPSPLVLVRAGPGTGKTGTLIVRIERLLTEGVPPEGIAAITFTNRAAAEVKERIRRRVEKGGERVMVSTIHAFCHSILKEYWREAGFPSPPLLASDFEISEIWKGIKNRGWRGVAEEVSRMKADFISPEEVAGNEIRLLYEEYQHRLSKQGLMDVDDTLFLCLKLLKGDDEVLKRVSSRWKVILVDEFQDLNRCQFGVLECLVDAGSRLFAIGDPDQAIYGFRGASPAFFLETERREGVGSFALARNHRSTERIVSFANSVMGKGKGEGCIPLRRGGEEVIFYQAMSEWEEADFVATTIESLLGGTGFLSVDSRGAEGGEYGPSDIAVLYRINALSPLLEEHLGKRGITCRRLDHARRSARSGIEAFGRFLKGVQAVLSGGERTLPFRFAGIELPLPPLKGGLKEWALRSMNTLVKAGHMKEEDGRALGRMVEDFEGDLTGLVEFLPLLLEMDLYMKELEAVSLLTIHASKGLEFPVVFIAGCDDGIIPLNLYPEIMSDPEEERRVLYVGATRAKERLYLTSSKRRRIRGRLLDLSPSPFIVPLMRRTIKPCTPLRKKRDRDSQLPLF